MLRESRATQPEAVSGWIITLDVDWASELVNKNQRSTRSRTHLRANTVKEEPERASKTVSKSLASGAPVGPAESNRLRY